MDALPGAIDWQAKPAPDFLALFLRGLSLVQCADLKDVGVVPAFPQGGVREDETQPDVGIKEAFLVAHNQVVGGLVSGGVAACIPYAAIPILRKVAIVHIADIERN